MNALLSKMGLDPNADLADLSGGRKRRVLLLVLFNAARRIASRRTNQPFRC